MKSRRKMGTILFAISLGHIPAESTWATDLWENIPYGLGYAGFDFVGSRNPLSGGADFLATQTFQGNPLDFGAWDLTLEGPLSLQVSTGGRNLSQFDITLATAPDGGTSPTPLNYVLNYDVGGQSTQISGSLLVNADFSLNGFGFYDLDVTYSSRQNVSRDGTVITDDSTHDMDYGPVRISGNIFTDAVVAILDPLFEQAGRPNPFENLSGAAKLNELLTGFGDSASALLNPTDAGDLGGANRAIAFGRNAATGLLVPAAEFNRANGVVAPEPTVLIFMLLGLPAILARSRFGRSTN